MTVEAKNLSAPFPQGDTPEFSGDTPLERLQQVLEEKFPLINIQGRVVLNDPEFDNAFPPVAKERLGVIDVFYPLIEETKAVLGPASERKRVDVSYIPTRDQKGQSKLRVIGEGDLVLAWTTSDYPFLDVRKVRAVRETELAGVKADYLETTAVLSVDETIINVIPSLVEGLVVRVN